MEFYLVFLVFYVHLVHIFPPNFSVRRDGIQEVSGSIPLISTIEALKTIGFQGFFLCATLFPMAKLFLLTRICLQWRCVYSVQCVSSTWKAAANRCTASSLMESWT